MSPKFNLDVIASSMTTTTATVTTALSVVAVYLIVRRLRSSGTNPGGLPHPPSIGSLPLVGSIPYLPKDMADLHHFCLEKTYSLGGVFSFTVAGSTTVLLTTHESIREAFVKRSTDFADRPKHFEHTVLNPKNKGIADHMYNADFNKYKQLTISILRQFGLGQSTMENRINAEVELLIENIRLLNGKCFNPSDLVHSSMHNILYGILFGKRFEANDKDIKQMFDYGFTIVTLIFELFLLDVLPALKYLPSYRKCIQEATDVQRDMFDMINRSIDDVLRYSPEDDTISDSFVSCYVKQEGETLDREQLVYTIRDLILGSTDSSNQVMWALVLLANHPDIQTRLQQELDEAVPADRSPVLEDKSRMPYMEATVLELLRYKMVAQGFPRATVKDTQVGGYFIPANTTVVSILYAPSFNTDVWEEPKIFKPDRFLDETGKIIKKELIVTFSMGKRACPGEILARQQAFLFIAGLLQRFDIRPPEGESYIDCKEIFMGSLLTSPYNVRLLARTMA